MVERRKQVSASLSLFIFCVLRVVLAGAQRFVQTTFIVYIFLVVLCDHIFDFVTVAYLCNKKLLTCKDCAFLDIILSKL